MTFVDIATGPSVDAVPLFSILIKLAFVFISRYGIFENPEATFQSIFELAFVKTTIFPIVFPLPVELTFNVASLV